MVSKAQIKRDIAAITSVLSQCKSIFNPNTEQKTGGWVSVANVYLRAGEELYPAIEQMQEQGLIESHMFGEHTYLRLA
jgi:hypothetical protein